MEWKTFIRTTGVWLLLDNFIFSINCTINSLYYINVYSRVFDIHALSMQRILQSSTGFLITALIVYKAIEYIKLKHVLFFALISYPCLALFMISNETYLLGSAIVGTIFSAFMQIFQSRIRAENVIQEHRIKWNNLSGLVNQMGIIIGSGIGSLALLDKFPFWLSFTIIFIIFDISTIITVIGIKMKKIKY